VTGGLEVAPAGARAAADDKNVGIWGGANMGGGRSESLFATGAQTNAGSLGDRGDSDQFTGRHSSDAGASELGVTGARTEHLPFYLRTSFRVLAGWVHHLKPPDLCNRIRASGTCTWAASRVKGAVVSHIAWGGHRLAR
jgi:hypothetical protein